MDRQLQKPLLKSERARRLLATPEPSWAKKHPLVSSLIVAGALLVSGFLIHKYAPIREQKADVDSARVSVSANASEKDERANQLRNILKMRKALEGKIGWARGGEEDRQEEVKEEIFAMGSNELDDYRDKLEGKIEKISNMIDELNESWLEWGEDDARKSGLLSAMKKEAEGKLGIANEESWKRRTEYLAIEAYEWRGLGELEGIRNMFRERVEMKEWGSDYDKDYVQRAMLVLNWAINEREMGETGLSLPRGALSADRSAFIE